MKRERWKSFPGRKNSRQSGIYIPTNVFQVRLFFFIPPLPPPLFPMGFEVRNIVEIMVRYV